MSQTVGARGIGRLVNFMIVNIINDGRQIVAVGEGIGWICQMCSFQALLELETGLSTFTMTPLMFLMLSIGTYKVAFDHRMITGDDGADVVVSG
jgi:hypothetical protein